MVTTKIQYAEKYGDPGEKFKKVFQFLREIDLLSLPVGKVPIDGDEIFADVQSYTTMLAEECPFESHKKYFDIQYVAEGEEAFGYEPVEHLSTSTTYDEARDLIFYEEPEQSGKIILRAGDFAIVPPEDGHAPRRMTENGACKVKKIVVKVRV